MCVSVHVVSMKLLNDVQVVPACLEKSGLLDSAISQLLTPSTSSAATNLGQLTAVHILGGILSVRKGRDLFPRPVPSDLHHLSGMVWHLPSW